MELTPQAIRVAGFTTVKRGYDPEEVDAFKAQVAAELESMQSQAAAMEARARAAVAKLQELTQQGIAQRTEAPPEPTPPGPSADEVPDMISRTLLLAQRTADAAIADAREEAASIIEEGRDEAARLLESARAMAARTVDDARHEARRSAEDERVRIENEVQALLARRDFLVADVDHLELYIEAERDRLREAANHLFDLIDRIPGGLGETRRPLLSAAADSDSFWVEPAAVSATDGDAAQRDLDHHDDGGDPTMALAPTSGSIVGSRLDDEARDVVDATVEVLHRLLPDAEAPRGEYDDWDDSSPTELPPSPAVSGAVTLDDWDDDEVPMSGTSRPVGGFEDDSFWSMPRPGGDDTFADLSDEIPRPRLDEDATVPMIEPTPVNGELRIGGDDLD